MSVKELEIQEIVELMHSHGFGPLLEAMRKETVWKRNGRLNRFALAKELRLDYWHINKLLTRAQNFLRGYLE